MASRNTRLANFRLSDPNYLAAQNIRDLEATDDPKAGWVGLISKVLRGKMAGDARREGRAAFDASENKITNFNKELAQILGGTPTQSMAFRENDNLFGQPTRQDNLTAPTPTFNMPTANPRQKIEQAYLGSDIDGNPALGLTMAVNRLNQEEEARKAIAARDEGRKYTAGLLKTKREREDAYRESQRENKLEVARITHAGKNGGLSKVDIKYFDNLQKRFNKLRENKAAVGATLKPWEKNFMSYFEHEAPGLKKRFDAALSSTALNAPVSSGNVLAPQTQSGSAPLTEQPPKKRKTIAEAKREQDELVYERDRYGKYYDATLPKILKSSDLANQGLDSIRSMEKILETLQTGKLADATADVRGLMNSMGFKVNVNQLANAEAFRTISMEFVLKLIEKTKGAISERENTMFIAASPNLKNSVEGNRLILKMAKARAQTQLKIDQRTQKLMEARTPPSQIAEELDKYREELAKTVVFDKDEMQTLAQNNFSFYDEEETPTNFDGLSEEDELEELKRLYGPEPTSVRG